MSAALAGAITELAAGTIFLFVGVAVCAIAAIRRRRGIRVFLWLGIWSAMYGAVRLCDSRAILAASPRWFRLGAPYASTAMSYLLVVAGSLSFLELSRGRLRAVMHAAIGLGLAIALAGLLAFATTGSTNRWMAYNNLLATGVLLILIVMVAVPDLSARYLALPSRNGLALPSRNVLVVGTLAFAIEALYVNLGRPVGFRAPRILDHLGFAALLFSFGYVALQQVLITERRLLAVDSELAVARDIQLAILPASTPRFEHLRISAAYLPMTAVAGDFYDFVAVDPSRAGVLVADVAGHGVPAALIASMIKVAMQSVAASAPDPQAVLRGLNRVLCGQRRSPLASAAYLWLDTDTRTARYSAAGHPPLLCWRHGRLERFLSNGLLLGMAEDGDYPVFSTPLCAGDRFLLYTDGVIETEDGRGAFFGDRRLEEVIRDHQRRTSSELSDILLGEVARWRPASVPQQDDITLIVIDVG